MSQDHILKISHCRYKAEGALFLDQPGTLHLAARVFMSHRRQTGRGGGHEGTMRPEPGWKQGRPLLDLNLGPLLPLIFTGERVSG